MANLIVEHTFSLLFTIKIEEIPSGDRIGRDLFEKRE
jgi:hypothetical protein